MLFAHSDSETSLNSPQKAQ